MGRAERDNLHREGHVAVAGNAPEGARDNAPEGARDNAPEGARDNAPEGARDNAPEVTPGIAVAAAPFSRRAPGSRHMVLRACTAGIHRDLDQAVEAAGYFDSLPRYAEYIAALHLFHRRFDAEIAGGGAGLDSSAGAALGGIWSKRWRLGERTGWLATDLAALGQRERSGAEMPKTGTPQIGTPQIGGLQITGASALLGALYVLIGSELGARLLVRRAHAIGLPPAGGATYLEGLAASPNWPQFLSVLEAAPDIDIDRMCESAVATFASISHDLAEGTGA
ncbi:MAG: biliverdin-producing heme oxygenase [Hyphomicrobium sp.]